MILCWRKSLLKQKEDCWGFLKVESVEEAEKVGCDQSADAEILKGCGAMVGFAGQCES